MLSERSSLYITGSRIFKILKDPSLAKSNLLLNYMVEINIIFVLDILYKKYTLFFFLKVSSQTLLLLVNFFITICGTSSSHFLVFIETSALNPLFIKNGVLLVILCSDVLYASISISSSLT